MLRTTQWRAELKRMQPLCSVGQGRRAFLVGNGPSLRDMDLLRLEGEFICLVNTGVRVLGAPLSQADMHVVNDIHCYRRFGPEIEAIAARYPLAYRFLNIRMRRAFLKAGAGQPPFFIINNPRKLAAGQPIPDLQDGVVTGSSVLISAAVLLRYMGFETIYVIGCDLDYQSAGAYFYDMQDADLAHEDAPDVAARRRNVITVDAQFAILRADFERQGQRIYNAGLGGDLDSLPRVDFASLFAAD